MLTLYTVYCHSCRCAASALAIRCQHLEWSWTGCDPESSSIHHIKKKKTLVGVHVSSTAINRRATWSCILQRWNQSWTSVALVYCLISVLFWPQLVSLGPYHLVCVQQEKGLWELLTETERGLQGLWVSWIATSQSVSYKREAQADLKTFKFLVLEQNV